MNEKRPARARGGSDYLKKPKPYSRNLETAKILNNLGSFEEQKQEGILNVKRMGTAADAHMIGIASAGINIDKAKISQSF